jgi:hypothetical protein
MRYTFTFTPRSELMIDSLAEQVPGPVMMYTLLRPSVVSRRLAVPEPAKPCVVEWKGVGVRFSPVTGLRLGFLSLKTIFSNVRPLVSVGLAIW